MPEVEHYSVAERRREKELSRQRDLARVAQGQVEDGGLRDRNGFFSALDPARARVLGRRPHVRLDA